MEKGEHTQAIGRSRGGRTTNIHALTDGFCRLIAFLLTGGQVADCTAADDLLELMPATSILHGDKGYFRAYVEQVLVPVLSPGDVVAMDNLGSHKSTAVRDAVRAAGRS